MPDTDHKIRWGIIGLGNIAQSFATDLLTVSNGCLHGVASRDLNKAQEFAKMHHAQHAYGSYESLIADEQIDAVYIATPHTHHKEYTIACLKHKKAVLCEKPFAMNKDQVLEMIATAREHDVLLMEALWTYFLPHYRYVLDLINRKEFGTVQKLEADFGFSSEFDADSRLYNKDLGGGSLLDIGIYPVFIALSALGIPKEVNASAKFYKNGIDTECSVKFTYNNRSEAYLHSTIIKDTPTTATFYCEHGIIKINEGFYGPTTVTIEANNEQKTLDFGYTTKGFSYEIAHFNQLLLKNKKESPIMTYDFSIQLISLLDEIRKLIGLEYPV
ncbi:Predicted dehydrogenase [Zhouia amylolytica]|uniref:Predicted dehydrogenase n=1 Tax=Zhouia amylolytica TaxID=376730 RepID=A0A1I6TEC7_9FLAO|nr:Gfo/Idh/MocA family oxidoreductase [Zhouia amylolytica]SFS87536.1 Predicted dehydrogenase [Zhouia amylolytica]